MVSQVPYEKSWQFHFHASQEWLFSRITDYMKKCQHHLFRPSYGPESIYPCWKTFWKSSHEITLWPYTNGQIKILGPTYFSWNVYLYSREYVTCLFFLIKTDFHLFSSQRNNIISHINVHCFWWIIAHIQKTSVV